MPTIYSYQKYIDNFTTRYIKLPESLELHGQIGTELAVLNGLTYVCLPDGYTLPVDQPVEIASSIVAVKLTPELSAAIAAASPHVALIRTRVKDKIAEKYTLTDEVGMLRGKAQAPSATNSTFDKYNTFVELVRAWGEAEKAKLGLG
jgi:hypothetical protein